MAFDHPGVSSASYPVDSPAFYTIQKNSGDFEAYEFYVSHMLFAAETILDLSKNQKKWRNVLKDQLRYHALYIGSETFPRDHYEDDLLTLIDEAIADYQRDAASDARSPNTMRCT